MEAEAAFVGAERVVVLDAIALVEPVVPVVHLDWEVDHDLVLGLGEDDLDAVAEVDDLRRLEHGGHSLRVEVVGVLGEPEFVEDGVPSEELCVGRGGSGF